MTANVPKQFYRGVLCTSCRQPIPLPAIVNSLEGSSGNSEASSRPERVFSLRCRACGREMPYRSAEIVELEGTPRRRIDHLGELYRARRHQEGLSRAANS